MTFKLISRVTSTIEKVTEIFEVVAYTERSWKKIKQMMMKYFGQTNEFLPEYTYY